MAPSKLGFVQRFVAAFQALLGPINLLPSWANEALTALVLLPVFYVLLGIWGFIVFEVASAIYEWWPWPRIDPNGYSAEDVGQRSVAAVLTLLAMVGLHLLGIHRFWFFVAGPAILVGAYLFARHEYGPR